MVKQEVIDIFSQMLNAVSTDDTIHKRLLMINYNTTNKMLYSFGLKRNFITSIALLFFFSSCLIDNFKFIGKVENKSDVNISIVLSDEHLFSDSLLSLSLGEYYVRKRSLNSLTISHLPKKEITHAWHFYIFNADSLKNYSNKSEFNRDYSTETLKKYYLGEFSITQKELIEKKILISYK